MGELVRRAPSALKRWLEYDSPRRAIIAGAGALLLLVVCCLYCLGKSFLDELSPNKDLSGLELGTSSGSTKARGGRGGATSGEHASHAGVGPGAQPRLTARRADRLRLELRPLARSLFSTAPARHGARGRGGGYQQASSDEFAAADSMWAASGRL